MYRVVQRAIRRTSAATGRVKVPLSSLREFVEACSEANGSTKVEIDYAAWNHDRPVAIFTLKEDS